jgi:hypothetical protein
MIQKWRVGDDDVAWNDDLRKPPFYDKTRPSPTFNLLFAALWDLILCSMTKMSNFAPTGGRSLHDIFDQKIPAVEGAEEDDVNIKEKNLVSPELIAYLKWLIYTAPFKDPFAEPRGSLHIQFYVNWVRTYATQEDQSRKRLFEALEIWYDKFPITKKRGRQSLVDKLPKASCAGGAVLDDLEADYVPPCRPAVRPSAGGAGEGGRAAE